MQTIGNYLKSGREARNIRLSEVARSTKISKWYLDCLEKDEFDKIPGGPYIKGYIASYASFIGLEEDEILKRYDSLQINSADENEIQDHPPQDKKRQNLKGFSFGKKNLVILSLAVLILLAIGVNYFFFQNQTHIAAQKQEAQDSKMQSASASKIKPAESRSVPSDSSVQSAKLKDFTKNSEIKIQKKQETARPSKITDLSKKNHLNAIKTEDESHQKYQDATDIESLAFLSPEQNSGKNNIKRPALADSKSTLPQKTPGTADLYSGSAPEHQPQGARLQAANNMRVKRVVAASDIINRNPVGLSNSFQWTMEKVYIWTMIECEQPPSSIRHTYYFKGQIVNDVELEINSPEWRTWSYKNLLDKRYIGHWRVDITSDEGNILQSVFFEVY
jgi:cytoskeletal protein RodZ